MKYSVYWLNRLNLSAQMSHTMYTNLSMFYWYIHKKVCLEIPLQLVFSSSTCFLLQDICVSNCSPYHVISIQPLSLIFMDDHQFDRHALSLYRFYLERGCLVTFQLWTTKDGCEHFKIFRPPTIPFRPPTLSFRPPTKLFPNEIPPFPRKTRRGPKKSFAQAVSQSNITTGNKSSSQ